MITPADRKGLAARGAQGPLGGRSPRSPTAAAAPAHSRLTGAVAHPAGETDGSGVRHPGPVHAQPFTGSRSPLAVLGLVAGLRAPLLEHVRHQLDLRLLRVDHA